MLIADRHNSCFCISLDVLVSNAIFLEFQNSPVIDMKDVVNVQIILYQII